MTWRPPMSPAPHRSLRLPAPPVSPLLALLGLLLLSPAVADAATGDSPTQAASSSSPAAWSPDLSVKRFLRVHVPIYVGGRLEYPNSVPSIAAGLSVDVWIRNFAVEAGVRAAFSGEDSGIKVLQEDGSVGDPESALTLSYLRITGRAGAKALLPIYGPGFQLAFGGGFAAGGLRVGAEETHLGLGGYAAVELILGPALHGKAASSGQAGYVSVRIEQDFLAHPLPALGFQAATTLVFGFAPGGGGMPPGFLGP